MYEQMTFTVLTTHTSSSPYEFNWKLPAGVIHHVRVQFRPGARGVVDVQMFHGGHQLYPRTIGETFSTDGETIDFRDFYELLPGWNRIKIRAWSTNATYSHKITIALAILPRYILDPYESFSILHQKLTLLLRRIGAI